MTSPIARTSRPTTVVIFGASALAQQILSVWPAEYPPVSAIVDNDPARWGTSVEGHLVQSPDVLHQYARTRLRIVVASVFYESIAEQLTGMGFSEGFHVIRAADLSGHWALVGAGTGTAQQAPARAYVVKCLWFDVDWRQFESLCRDAGVQLVFGPVNDGNDRAGVHPTRDNYRTLRWRGVPLMAAATYDICVALRVPVERLDTQDPVHWATIVDHLRHAAAVAETATEALEDVQPTVLVLPQGYNKTAAVHRYAAILRGLRVVALENTLNGERLMWDDVAGVAVNRVIARNYFWRWADLVDPHVAAAHVAWYLASIKRLKQAQHASPDRTWDGPPQQGPVLLFLANVLTDSSVMFNSRVGSQIDAIRDVARWSLQHGCTFVLKVHPRERPGHCAPYEGLTMQALREDPEFLALVGGSDRVVIDADNRFDTYDLIRKSDVCVTTCSQAGLEALMMGRETVVLGDAYYGGLGFTHEVHDRAQLGAALGAALDPSSRRADADTIARFFYVLDRLYCVEKSERGVLELILRTLGRAPLATLDDARSDAVALAPLPVAS